MPGPNGEERRENDELLRYMTERFDRMEDRAATRFDDLAREIQLTRHGGREALTMVTEQLVATVQTVALHGQTLEGHTQAIGELERRTGEDGPIDRRFRRHDGRIVKLETGQATAGRFTWGDVWKTTAGLGATIGLVGGLLAIARVLASTGAG